MVKWVCFLLVGFNIDNEKKAEAFSVMVSLRVSHTYRLEIMMMIIVMMMTIKVAFRAHF